MFIIKKIIQEKTIPIIIEKNIDVKTKSFLYFESISCIFIEEIFPNCKLSIVLIVKRKCLIR